MGPRWTRAWARARSGGGAAALFLLLASASAPVDAQSHAPDSLDGSTLRRRLQEELATLNQGATTAASMAPGQGEATHLAEVLRWRLEHGDFRAGDHVVVTVDGEAELSDTLAVQPGPALEVPLLGRVELDGLLAPELTERLQEGFAGHLIDPRVRTRLLVRLSISGAVVSPGFYLVPADAFLSDALMAAGGPLPDARTREVRVERDAVAIGTAAGSAGQDLYATPIADLGLRTGDDVILPGKRTSIMRVILDVALGAAALVSFVLR